MSSLVPTPGRSSKPRVRFNEEGIAVDMRERGVRIATFGYASAGTCIRVSTGFPEDTDAFLRILPDVLAAL